MEQMIESIRKLTLQEDDLLVVNLDHSVSSEFFKSITNYFQTVLPGVKVLILEKGQSLSVVTREQPPCCQPEN